MSTCRSCGAPVRWERTAAGKPIPLDPEPRPDGNLAFRDDGRVYSLPQSTLDDVPRYVTHFATCPHANQHRKPKT